MTARARPILARLLMAALLVAGAALSACSPEAGEAGSSGDAARLPTGDPPFTPLADSWVIDNVGVLAPATVRETSALCQRLRDDGIAEVVVLVQNGVRHPADYATHYGRWLRLGRRGLSTEGGNNGLVWLVRPDADPRMTYSVGRGLPRLTSGHMAGIMDAAREYMNFHNYDEGVRVLVGRTDQVLRDLYERKGNPP